MASDINIPLVLSQNYCDVDLQIEVCYHAGVRLVAGRGAPLRWFLYTPLAIDGWRT